MHTSTQHQKSPSHIPNELLHLLAQHTDAKDRLYTLLHYAQNCFSGLGAALLCPDLSLYLAISDSITPSDSGLSLQSITNPTIYEDNLVMPVTISEDTTGLLYVFSIETKLSAQTDIIAPLTDAIKIALIQWQTEYAQMQDWQRAIAALNANEDAIILTDANNLISYINTTAQALFSVSSSTTHGQALSAVLQDTDLLAHLPQDNNQSEWVGPNEHTYIPYSQPVTYQQQIVGWVIILRDITRFKHLNRNQYEFIRNVTHDLRSPLTSMHGFATMLEMGAAGDVSEKQIYFLKKIISGINQISILVDNIQDAGRYDPETGFHKLNREQCDIFELIQRTVDNHLIPNEKSNLQISISTDSTIPIISVDTTMLERALRNLVDNAIKYTPDMGTIQVSATKEQEKIIISVADTGPGINEEDQRRIFERGVRIYNTNHKKVKGSGLGLFIVRSVARRHGGDAWVSSTPGTGSTFSFSIPLTDTNLVIHDPT